MDIKETLLTELNRNYVETVFFIEEYDGFWQCSWTDGPTKNQIDYFLSKQFPIGKLGTTCEKVVITDGFEHFRPENELRVRLIRYLSSERLAIIQNSIGKKVDEIITDEEIMQHETYLIRNGLLSGYQLNMTTRSHYLYNRNDDKPSLLSAADLCNRHNKFQNLNYKDKLMLTTLLRVLGENRVYELIEEGEDTIEEIFEAVAYTLFSDGTITK